MSPQELAAETSAQQAADHLPTSDQPTDASFDWWSAPAAARERQELHRERHPFLAEAVDDTPAAPDRADIYRSVHQSPEFREIRSRYRRFVFPATAAFLLWYLLYVVLAVSAPQLMAHPIAGPLNTAWLLGLLQFASTFLLTWLYARHTRAHRDRAALGLRWETQDRLR